MDKLGVALIDLEMGGLPLALVRAKHPDVIIRDNGSSFHLLLRGEQHIVIEEMEVPKGRDLRPDSLTESAVKQLSFKPLFGKKRFKYV